MTRSEHPTSAKDDKVAKLEKAKGLLLQAISSIDEELAKVREERTAIPLD